MTDKIADDERKLAAELQADADARDAAATPPAAPVPVPVPAPMPDPAPAPNPTLGLVLVGHEYDTVPLLLADADGKYGADTRFISVTITVAQAAAGLKISNDTMGGDPAYLVPKGLYLPPRLIASGSTTNPVTPAPAPPPIAPSPPLPPIVPIPAGSLPAWISKAPLMTVTPVGVAARDVPAVAANVTGQSFNAWCGTAWNRETSDFTKGPDGGHVCPPGYNALIGLCALDDVPTPRLIIASVAEAFRDPNSDGSYASPDGNGKIPGATHTYTTEWWDRFSQKHMRGSSCAAYAASGGSNYIASANVAAGTWDKRGSVPDSPFGMGYDSCVAVDESTGDVFFQAANNSYRALRKADGTFHDFTGSGTKGGYWDNGYGPHAVDPKRRRILNVVNQSDSGHSPMGYRKFDDPTDFYPVTVIGVESGYGVPVPWGGSGFGTDHLEVDDAVYICAHDCSSYWKLTFPDDNTFKFEQLPVIGVTPSPGPGIYSRFRVCPHTLSLLVWPTFEDPLQVIRLRDVTAGGTTPPVTPVTPTPTPEPAPFPPVVPINNAVTVLDASNLGATFTDEDGDVWSLGPINGSWKDDRAALMNGQPAFDDYSEGLRGLATVLVGAGGRIYTFDGNHPPFNWYVWNKARNDFDLSAVGDPRVALKITNARSGRVDTDPQVAVNVSQAGDTLKIDGSGNLSSSLALHGQSLTLQATDPTKPILIDGGWYFNDKGILYADTYGAAGGPVQVKLSGASLKDGSSFSPDNTHSGIWIEGNDDSDPNDVGMDLVLDDVTLEGFDNGVLGGHAMSMKSTITTDHLTVSKCSVAGTQHNLYLPAVRQVIHTNLRSFSTNGAGHFSKSRARATRYQNASIHSFLSPGSCLVDQCHGGFLEIYDSCMSHGAYGLPLSQQVSDQLYNAMFYGREVYFRNGQCQNQSGYRDEIKINRNLFINFIDNPATLATPTTYQTSGNNCSWIDVALDRNVASFNAQHANDSGFVPLTYKMGPVDISGNVFVGWQFEAMQALYPNNVYLLGPPEQYVEEYSDKRGYQNYRLKTPVAGRTLFGADEGNGTGVSVAAV